MCKLKIEDSARKIMYCGDVSGYPKCLTQPEIRCELKAGLRLYAKEYTEPPKATGCKLI